MGLVKTSKEKTNYYLPVIIKTNKGNYKKNRYYDNEFQLFKAYRQLKKIENNVIPLFPIIFEERVQI